MKNIKDFAKFSERTLKISNKLNKFKHLTIEEYIRLF